MSSTSSLLQAVSTERPPSNPLADTNKDGVVNLFDLVFVAEHLNQNAAAPSQLAIIKSIPSSTKEVIAAQRALTELEAIPNKSPGRIQVAIELLRLLPSPSQTRTSKRPNSCPTIPTPSTPTHGFRINYPKPLQSLSKSTM